MIADSRLLASVEAGSIVTPVHVRDMSTGPAAAICAMYSER